MVGVSVHRVRERPNVFQDSLRPAFSRPMVVVGLRHDEASDLIEDGHDQVATRWKVREYCRYGAPGLPGNCRVSGAPETVPSKDPDRAREKLRGSLFG